MGTIRRESSRQGAVVLAVWLAGLCANVGCGSRRSPVQRPEASVEATRGAFGESGAWQLAGTWDDEANFVTVEIVGPVPGDGNVTVSYNDSDKSCMVRGGYVGRRDDRLVFAVGSQNGGAFCDRLKVLYLWRGADESLAYTVTPGKETSDGRLRRREQ